MPLGPIADRARDTPDALALVDDASVRTWSQVDAEIRRASASMLAVAADSDIRWGVLGDNASPTLIAHAAGLLAGVGTVAISRQLTLRELADQIDDANIAGLVTGPGGAKVSLAALEAGIVDIVVVHSTDVPEGAPDGAVAWVDWLQGSRVSDDGPVRPPRPIMVYTSGTTGRARGTETRWVLGPAATSGEYLERLRARAQFPPGPHIVAGPLQHNGPLAAVRHLLLGEPVVVMGKFDAAAALRLIGEHGVRSSVMVPTHFQRMLAVDPDVRASSDVSSIMMIAHTGSACPPDVKRAMIDWFGPVFTESYGGSESGTLCRINSSEWLAHPGSVGRAVEPYRILVLDDQGDELPVGEQGLLAFEAPDGYGITYHLDPEKTAKAYVRPGVFTLGDVGHVDGEGFIFVTDRVSDMVVSGGVNLYPSESEQVLLEHPAVGDVAVIGVPHADLGEQLLALIVPVDPASPPAPAELEAWCREHLGGYKIPRLFEFIEVLPRNEMQKIDKKALRKPYWGSERTIGG
ncbi:MAG: AMP-binding protein [Actinobacteria bacterium]|nr:AMP-binding protein [Actinomycetota bacterium]